MSILLTPNLFSLIYGTSFSSSVFHQVLNKFGNYLTYWTLELEILHNLYLIKDFPFFTYNIKFFTCKDHKNHLLFMGGFFENYLIK